MYIAACNNSFKLLDMTSDLASKEESSNVDTSQVTLLITLADASCTRMHIKVTLGTQVEDALIMYGRDCQTRITQEIMKDLQVMVVVSSDVVADHGTSGLLSLFLLLP